MKTFSDEGMLILPPGTVNEHLMYRQEMHNKRQGVYLECVCGHRWQRWSQKAGILRCHKCGRRIEVEEVK